MASLLRSYNAALVARPYLAGSATAATLFGAGDVLAQQAVDKQGMNHDVVRTARLALYGGVIFAPVVTRWYQMLEGIKLKSKPARTSRIVHLRFVATRVGLDQFVLTPVLVSVFYTSMALSEGQGIQGAKERVRSAWWPTLQKNWGLFIPVQIANFAIVPAHLRLVLVNVVSLFWNAYLSYANSKSSTTVGKIEEKRKALLE
ncbi:BZ3500_MvSof-1268-A1-R1_Chr3-1g06059 [Microbotryum saponariae]|uniref:BZ3500_MvSof-1268-A1-R1_Chr3-1g06059 protein n=1 Tax=Microbotryum saponariae TaxID=289078 RepID=A0A2X0N942_9BASI|nr:BZ3500_MvSof-1268-A1-R1_Chr3-1g06059 [Microbotryum saponariae]SDA03882.1 BZ3501_MvSof-1269-A2-R1_Chr3-2g05744 [Microbotryum saponariae]